MIEAELDALSLLFGQRALNEGEQLTVGVLAQRLGPFAFGGVERMRAGALGCPASARLPIESNMPHGPHDIGLVAGVLRTFGCTPVYS